MSINSSSPTWESDKMLNVYIYDYCIKRNFKEAARAFFVEAKVPQDQQVPINAREGFLYEWWTVFWDIFSARANRSGSQDAMAYVDIQHDKSQQFAQWRKMQMMMAQNNGYPQTPIVSNAQPNATPEIPQSPVGNFPVEIDTNRFGPQNNMNTATASQILGFCSSMFLAQLGHKTIDQITELERISVLADMKNRRVFGYPELNDPTIRAQFMNSRCYLSLTQKIHSFSNQQGLMMAAHGSNGMVRPHMGSISSDGDMNGNKRARSMDSPMMAQAGTPRDSPLITQAVPVVRSASNGGGPTSPTNPWALPGFSTLPIQQQQQILTRHQMLERNRQALYAGNQAVSPSGLQENQDGMRDFHAKNLLKQQHQLFVQQQLATSPANSKPISRKKANSSGSSPRISRQSSVKQEMSTPGASSDYNSNAEGTEMSNASLEEIEKFWAMASNSQALTSWTSQDQSEDIVTMIEEDLFNMKGNDGSLETTETVKETQSASYVPESTKAVKSSIETTGPLLEPVASLVGHTNKVTACALESNSLLLASAGNDRKLTLWDVSKTDGTSVPLLHTEDKHFSKNVCSARFLKVSGFFNADDTEAFLLSEDIPVLLATCGYDKCVTITKIICSKSESGSAEVSSLTKATTFSGHQRCVTGVDFCPYAFFSSDSENGMNFFVASLDVEGDLMIWDAWTGNNYLSLKLPFLGKSYDVSSNPVRFKPMDGEKSNKCNIAAAFGKSLYYISVTLSINPEVNLTENVLPIATPHSKNITNLDWSKDGRWLITSSEDMAVVWDAKAASNSVLGLDLTSPFIEVCQIPAHSCKISFCTFLEPELVTEVTSNESGPPLVIFGEYQTMHIWKINQSSRNSVSPVRLTSIPNCLNGVVSCIDTCSNDSFNNPTILVASSSGGVKNNLKIWKFSVNQ